MDRRALVNNTVVAFAAQGVAFLLSALQSLLIPKVLGVEQYGYWQLFLFYVSYVGIFQLGLNDGIYLIHGGTTRAEINKQSINSQFLVGVVFEIAFSLAVVAIALFCGFQKERELVIVATGFCLVARCSAGYLGYLFQAMNETKRFSYSQIIERMAFLIPLLVLLVFQEKSFVPYVLANVFSAVVQLLYCLFFYRDFLKTRISKPRAAVNQALLSMRVGINLTLANIASQLILGVARFVIDIYWGIEVFGKLSLALALVGFFMSFVSQASMVLFPALRQAEKGEASSFYFFARDVLELLFPAAYILYFPLVIVLSLWLPDFSDSFVYFAYLLPICVFDSKMNITCTTFFKVRREERLLFKINVATVAFSCVGSLIGAFILHSIDFLIATVVLAIVMRSMYSERYLTNALGVPPSKAPYLKIALTLFFVVLVTLLPCHLATIIYIVAYAFYLAFHRHRFVELVEQMRFRKR